jgi:hypothetical protein
MNLNCLLLVYTMASYHFYPLTRTTRNSTKPTLLGDDGNTIFTIMAEGQRLSVTLPWRAAALYNRQVSVARANE